MTVIERVQQLLKENNQSARDLCRSANLKEGTYSAWKKRGTNPSAEFIAPIAEFLGVSIYYLLTGEEPPVERTTNDKAEERLLAYWSKFNEVGKAQMLTIANAYSHIPEYNNENEGI